MLVRQSGCPTQPQNPIRLDLFFSSSRGDQLVALQSVMATAAQAEPRKLKRTTNA